MPAQTATPPDPTPTAPPPSAAAESRLLIADQLAMLRRVAEVGLEVALEVERQARGEAPEGGKPAALGDIALAYARTARAMRLTVMLQSRLVKELGSLDDTGAKASAEAGDKADQVRLDQEQARKGSVERIVGRVAEAAGQDDDKAEDLVREASERLDDDNIYGDVLARPVSEIVADICADLGLAPDWPSLSAEAWAQAEIAGGPAGTPLQGLGQPGRAARPPPPPFHPLRPSPPRAASRRDEEEEEKGPVEYTYSWLTPETAPAEVPP